ncbi:hypothetical protein F66182_1091 [Fusarium sp. NRRL 66182]|nr:hypothetical protein F66182_1091 [Fusarium sp. NRRL 66182]
MVERKRSILVVGAGLDGLAAVLALQTDGHIVTVLEAASKFTDVGSGIHLPPQLKPTPAALGVKLPEG